MHKLLVWVGLLISGVGIYSCSNHKEFVLHGALSNCQERVVILVNQDERHAFCDTVPIDKNGHFNYKRAMKSSSFLELYLGSNLRPVSLYAKSGVTTLAFDYHHPEKIIISGSKEQTHLNEYHQLCSAYYHSIDSIQALANRFEDDSLRLMQLLSQLEQTTNTFKSNQLEFIDYNRNSLTGSYAAYQLIEQHYSDLKEVRMLYDRLKKNHKRFYYTQKIKERLLQLQRIQPGSLAPSFVLQDECHHAVSLNQSLGKYTLLSFWASWCNPCKREFPKLKSLYAQFHNRGFEVVKVSLDHQQQSWKNVIMQEDLHWKNLIAENGWNSHVVSLYGLKQLPSNFLLNQQGEIVATNLSTDTLEQHLNRLLPN